MSASHVLSESVHQPYAIHQAASCDGIPTSLLQQLAVTTPIPALCSLDPDRVDGSGARVLLPRKVLHAVTIEIRYTLLLVLTRLKLEHDRTQHSSEPSLLPTCAAIQKIDSSSGPETDDGPETEEGPETEDGPETSDGPETDDEGPETGDGPEANDAAGGSAMGSSHSTQSIFKMVPGSSDVRSESGDSLGDFQQMVHMMALLPPRLWETILLKVKVMT